MVPNPSNPNPHLPVPPNVPPLKTKNASSNVNKLRVENAASICRGRNAIVVVWFNSIQADLGNFSADYIVTPIDE